MSSDDIVLDESQDASEDAASLPAEIDDQDQRGAIFAVPLEVVISIGRASPTLGELAAFSRDTLLTLNSRIDDPVEILVNGRVIAQGELQETEDAEQLAVRITKVVDREFG